MSQPENGNSLYSPKSRTAASLAHLTEVGLWGPALKGDRPVVSGTSYTAAPLRKPWGMRHVFYAALTLVVTQVLFGAVMIALALQDTGIGDLDSLATDVTDQVLSMTMSPAGLLVALTLQWGVFVGFPLLATYRCGWRSLAQDLGLRFKATDLPVGLGLAVLLQGFMIALSNGLAALGADMKSADNTQMVTDSNGVTLVILIIAVTLGAPFTEELFFRGLVLRAGLRTFARRDLAPVLDGATNRFHDTPPSAGRARWGTIAAVVVSSTFFGVLHASSVDAAGALLALQTGLIGLVFALVALKTRRLGVTICAHVVFNTSSLALAFLVR